MIIPIQDTMCWRCGNKNKKLTSNHTLPQHLKPVNNIIVPVCEDCHNEINTNDITGMYTYIHKLVVANKKVNSGVNKLQQSVNNLAKIKITSKIKKK